MGENITALAFLGDAVYELCIREKLIQKGIFKPNTLKKESIKYVSAEAQNKIFLNLNSNNFFTEEEMEITKRGRNAKVKHRIKGDVIAYHNATGFEALFGYLYLKGDKKRIEEIIDIIIGGSND